MVYDNTKLEAAFNAWLKANVAVGFGEHYAGDLLDDFCEFLAETGMLKRSPGRVVFGKELKRHGGFDRRKSGGLTYWAGLALKKPRALSPKRYSKTVVADAEEAREREEIRLNEEADRSPEGRQALVDKFHKDMAEEDRKREELANETM